MKTKILVILFFALSCTCNYTRASVLYVSSGSPEGFGSLRAAIGSANAGDTIMFDITGVLTLDSVITWDKALNIIGPGAANLTIDGNNATNMFQILGGVNYITGLTFNHGNGANGDIFSPPGNVTDTTVVLNCVFKNSTTSDAGGAVDCSNGRYLIMRNCSIDSCTAPANLAGGIVAFYGCILENCTFSNCSSSGEAGCAWIVNNGSLVTNCTFYNNNAGGIGGAIFLQTDGEVFTLTLLNNTFAGNSAGTGGGAIYLRGAIGINSNLPLLTLQNNIFYGQNSQNYGAGTNASNYLTAVTSLGGNISNDTTLNTWLIATGDLTSTDPQLSPAGLQNNGGSLATIALVCTSPAINDGIAPGAPATDERGYPRTGGIDAGAYQYQAITFSQNVTICSSSVVTVGNHNHYTAGTYVDTLTTGSGCDSIVTTNLTVHSVDSTVTVVGTTLVANNATGKTFQWIYCDSDGLQIPGATGLTFTPTHTATYAVVVSLNGCTDTSACIGVEVSGINEVGAIPGLSVYPNPATDMLTVTANGKIDYVYIYSVTGQKVKQLIAPLNNKISLAGLAPGIYTIEVQIGDNTGRLKFVKDN